ncbi:MAG TPA: 2'-5' RNA ligase family protein [Gemmatimonadaceae bacterium]|nr:2'-5' RNA ligase family protein [Gemmatimonadaceae bacterium]
MPLNGIFILAELPGEIGERVRAINESYDPKLARYKPPHLTLTGSSGAGPLPPSVGLEEMRNKLEPIASDTPPITLRFQPPQRFMQSDIIVLPIEPHGPIRVLHDRLVTSGLPFTKARYTFSPHCTLSLYPSLDRKSIRELLNIRLPEPFVISAIQLYHTRDPQPSRKLLELPLSGGSAKA